MKLINNSIRNYIAFDTVLEAGKVLEIKDKEIAKLLLNQPDVEEYIDKEEVKRLKEENKKLKEAKAAAKAEAEAAKTLETARTEANKMMMEANVNYRKIVGDAEERCRKIIFDAESRASLAENAYNNQVKKAMVHRNHMMHLLKTQMELLENFEDHTVE